ncbi:MAG: DoxX family protein [Woeseiaceae bacterium]|nr:DoxX family protein [Woeseiaceae bacterium]
MNNQTGYAALILRLSLGSMFLAHGLLKVVVFTLPGTAGFFESVGFPAALAYVVTAAEIGGGALLIAGIAVRPIAIAMTPILLGALYVHWNAGWVFSNANGGWEYPAYLLATSVATALLGPGKFALKLPTRSGDGRNAALA